MHWKAIAAMAQNRVIGRNNRIPWHLPEDFRWFKQRTMGQILVMGRNTFESIGKPLPGRLTLVLSRAGGTIPGVKVVRGLEEVIEHEDGREVFICGGSQVYAQALPFCSDLYLSLVKREVDGDAFFPAFEDQFMLSETILQRQEFDVLHYKRRHGSEEMETVPG